MAAWGGHVHPHWRAHQGRMALCAERSAPRARLRVTTAFCSEPGFLLRRLWSTHPAEAAGSELLQVREAALCRAKSLRSCPIFCDPMDPVNTGSGRGEPRPPSAVNRDRHLAGSCPKSKAGP